MPLMPDTGLPPALPIRQRRQAPSNARAPAGATPPPAPRVSEPHPPPPHNRVARRNRLPLRLMCLPRELSPLKGPRRTFPTPPNLCRNHYRLSQQQVLSIRRSRPGVYSPPRPVLSLRVASWASTRCAEVTTPWSARTSAMRPMPLNASKTILISPIASLAACWCQFPSRQRSPSIPPFPRIADTAAHGPLRFSPTSRAPMMPSSTDSSSSAPRYAQWNIKGT